jgi:hypothetical protein
MADGWGVVVMNAREEISSIHWRLQPGNLTPGFASAHFYTGPDLVVVLTLLSWGWTSDGCVTNSPQKYLSMGAKTIAIGHILVAHHAGLPSRSR